MSTTKSVRLFLTLVLSCAAGCQAQIGSGAGDPPRADARPNASRADGGGTPVVVPADARVGSDTAPDAAPPRPDGASDARVVSGADAQRPSPTDAGAPLGEQIPCGRRVDVANVDQLKAALAAPAAGDCVVLADGVYSDTKPLTFTAVGTATAPVVLRAANLGRAEITGGLWFTVARSAYVVIEGLLFTNTPASKDHGAIRLDGSHHCRITRNTFRLKAASASLVSKWVFIINTTPGTNADHNRIDHNLFENKTDKGNFITTDGDRTVMPNVAVQHTRIDHNHFRNNTPRAENEKEGIRLGWSGQSLSSGFNVVEHNLLENIDGDPEYISVKDCDNVIRYNTILTSTGTLTQRHGHRSRIYGNYILGKGKPGTGGIRLYGQDHQIYNNHLEGLTGTGYDAPLVIDGGDVDKSGSLNGHWKIYRATIAFNTLIGNGASHIEIGRNYDLPPEDVVLANNLIVGHTGRLLIVHKQPVNLKVEGNVVFASGSAVAPTGPGWTVLDPMMVPSGDIHRLSPSSPVIGKAVGTYDDVTDDVEGHARGATKDVGADQVSTSTARRSPLTAADVGPQAP